MSSPTPERTRTELLHELCAYLPAAEAQQLRAMDPADDNVHVAAFAAVKRHEVVLPEALHREVTSTLATLLQRPDTADPTSVEVRVEGEIALVDLIGELDIHLIEDLRATFLHVITPDSNQIVVNLERATFLDSIVLGSLVAAQRRAQESGGWLRLAAPRPNVQHVLRLTQLDQVFDVFETADEAASTSHP